MNKIEILKNVSDYWRDEHFCSPKQFIKGKTPVPVSGAWIDPDDVVSVVDVVLDGWFTEWTVAKKFSKSLVNYLGTEHAVLCNSGSSANLLAITACIERYRNSKRNKIVTCATGFPTTIAPIIQNGYVPLFVDVDPITLNPKPKELMDCIEREDVAGIIQAHTLGFALEDLLTIGLTLPQNKFFVEDCSDALGGDQHGIKLGCFGNAATFSFFPAHQITSGEGGAVCTKNDELAEIIRSYRDWGRACYCLPGQENTCGKRFSHTYENLPFGYDHKYVFERLGYNLKMTEMQAALGYSQSKKIDDFKLIRRGNYAQLYMGLLPLIESGIIYSPDVTKDNSCPFGFPITIVTNRVIKEELVTFLEGRKIHTRPVFAGNITRHPMMNGVEWESHTPLVGSDYVMERTFWVGCHPNLRPQMLEWVIDSVTDFFDKRL